MTGGIGLPSADRVEYIAHPVQVLARSVEMLRCQGRLPRSPLPNDKRRFWTSSAALVPSLRSSRSALPLSCLPSRVCSTNRSPCRSISNAIRLASGVLAGPRPSTAWSLSSVWKACLLCERPFANCLPTPLAWALLASSLPNNWPRSSRLPAPSRKTPAVPSPTGPMRTSRMRLPNEVSSRRSPCDILVACWMKRTSSRIASVTGSTRSKKMIRLSPYRYN